MALQSNKVKCDDCGKEFKISLRIDRLDNGIEKNFFTCPKCGTEYLVMYTSEESRAVQKRIEQITKDMNKNQREHQRYLRKYNKENKDLLKIINQQYNEHLKLVKQHQKLITELMAKMQ